MSMIFFTKGPDRLTDAEWMFTVRMLAEDRETASERAAWLALRDDKRNHLSRLYRACVDERIFRGLPGTEGAERRTERFAWLPRLVDQGRVVWLRGYVTHDRLTRNPATGTLRWIVVRRYS